MNRLLNFRIKFRHGNHQFYGDVACKRDGTLVSFFLDGGQPGSDMQNSCRDLAVAVSWGLKNGGSLKDLQSDITRLDNSAPAGPLGVFLDMYFAGEAK